MSSIGISLLAAIFTASASYFFRRNAEYSNGTCTSSGYLVIFYFCSLLTTVAFYPALWERSVNFILLALGSCVGVLSSTLMLLTAHALKRGPAGLTFAFQNASAIFPSLILFLLFGSDFGFSYSYIQLSGMFLVLFGLFLGAKKESLEQPKASSKWLKYALACFLIQILALTCIQARCLLFSFNEIAFFSQITEADDIWFMPGQFGASFIMQAFLFLREKKSLLKQEMVYGGLGGIANFSSTCLLLLATKYALPFEKGILFPCFAVASMVLCNIWSNKLYNERFNIRTNVLCSFGIFMAVSS